LSRNASAQATVCVAQRQHLDGDADLHAARAGRDGAGEQQGRGADRPLGEEVQLGEPDRVDAPALRGIDLVEDLSEGLRIGPPRRARNLVKDAELEWH
jgi:hypothetical protein